MRSGGIPRPPAPPSARHHGATALNRAGTNRDETDEHPPHMNSCRAAQSDEDTPHHPLCDSRASAGARTAPGLRALHTGHHRKRTPAPESCGVVKLPFASAKRWAVVVVDSIVHCLLRPPCVACRRRPHRPLLPLSAPHSSSAATPMRAGGRDAFARVTGRPVGVVLEGEATRARI